MFLSRIRIANFKSLKDVEINSEGLVALVGPNGAGKTNFALAMKFLAEVHQHGLEMAISRAGGFENIAYKRGRRTTAPIEFEVEVRFDAKQMQKRGGQLTVSQFMLREYSFVVRHSFSFKASGRGMRSEFVVVEETFQVEGGREAGTGLSGEISEGRTNTFTRDREGIVEQEGSELDKKIAEIIHGPVNGQDDRPELQVGKQQLLIASPYYRDSFMMSLSGFLGQVGVFCFSSDSIRKSSAFTPNPALDILGDNLPAMVDWLQKKQPKVWRGVLDAMMDVVPELREITVYPLASKTYGLLFQEEGVRQPWRIDEVSDGTIHALSMLVAAADPRTSTLVIEEPESSLHPWVIYELAKKLRDLSKDKTIFLTTHSPVLIDTLKPSEVWIVSRQKGKTDIQRLTEIAPEVEEHWAKGKVTLSQCLDSGLVPRAVPGGGL